jgi:outer membrane immunogenic protein
MSYLWRVYIAATFLSSTIVQTAIAETSQPNWEGPYSGFALGYGSSSTNPNTEINIAGYFTASGSADDKEQLDPIFQREIKDQSLTGSALLGYHFQSGNFVYGIEADLTRINSSLSRDSGSIAYDTVPGDTFNISTKIESDYQFSIRPKIAYAKDNFLFFASFGPSVSRFKSTQNFSDTFAINGSKTTDSKTVVGLSASVGANYAIGNDWSLRADYVLNKYSDIFDTKTDIDNDGDADDIDYKSDFESRNFRLAIIKQF